MKSKNKFSELKIGEAFVFKGHPFKKICDKKAMNQIRIREQYIDPEQLVDS